MKLLQLIIVFLAINLTTHAQTFFVTDIVDKSEEKPLTDEEKTKINALLIKELEKRKGDFCTQLYNGEEREQFASSKGFMMVSWDMAHRGGMPEKMGFDVYVVAIYADGSFFSESVIVENAARYMQMNISDETTPLEKQIEDLVGGMVKASVQSICPAMGDNFVQFTPELNQEVINVIKSDQVNLNDLLTEVNMVIMNILRQNYRNKNMGTFSACEYLAQSTPSRGISCVLQNVREFFGDMPREDGIKRMHNLIAMNNYWIYYNLYIQNYEETEASLKRINRELNIAPDLAPDYFALAVISNALKKEDLSIDEDLISRAKEKTSLTDVYKKVHFYLSEIKVTSHDENLINKATKLQDKLSSVQ
ncbi:hypothetical protein [Flammeovirga aprica]|uniref:Tetratricopeptide repeat protein n=1 Tax=Flammeovirga aprica JL-4 TaxID=694437 RepID=A0A7X9RT41_9BACT|nr:hypothetical protein [Flammeovirga aprica]NME66814.1 hypothetical protein [Flammeovirga aprica JL-4]